MNHNATYNSYVQLRLLLNIVTYFEQKFIKIHYVCQLKLCFCVFKSQNNVRSCNIITVNSTLRTLENMLCIQSAKLVSLI